MAPEIEIIIVLLVLGGLYLLTVVGDTLVAIKQSEEKAKQERTTRHTPKCPNCQCDELNRGR